MVVAVNDFAGGDLASQCGREHEGVEGQQQPVVLGELVSEDEANGDELGRLAPAFRGHALDGVETGFGDEGGLSGGRLNRSSRGHEALTGFLVPRSAFRIGRWSLLTSAATRPLRRPSCDIHRQPPFAGLQIFRGRRTGGFAGRGFRKQSFGFGDAVGLVLLLDPFGVGVATGRFAGGPEPALGRAF